MTNTNRTAIATGQTVTIKGQTVAIERIDRDGAFVMPTSDYARTAADRRSHGFSGCYYTVAMLRSMLKDGTLVLSAE